MGQQKVVARRTERAYDLSMKRKAQGINAAAWFYSQPGFHALPPITVNHSVTYTERSVGTAADFEAIQQEAEKCERRWVALRELLRKETA